MNVAGYRMDLKSQGSCFAYIHSNRNNLYRKQRLHSWTVKYNTPFVVPKSIMAFLLSKLRLEILGYHNSYDVYHPPGVYGPLNALLIERDSESCCVRSRNFIKFSFIKSLQTADINNLLFFWGVGKRIWQRAW